MNEININNRPISLSHAPFVIAELSANHNGSIETAKSIISAAKVAGADAVKLQTYRPDTITLDNEGDDFCITGGLWDGRTLYELYEEAHMPWDWHKPLFEHAAKVGITIFSSPFDHTAIDLLEDLNTPAYKIASFEAVDLPLIRYAASTGKPMIISTGLANLDEIEEAVNAAREAGCKELALLHCVSGYPAPAADYNLKTIGDMAARYHVLTGLSDHTLGYATAIASVALGASIIEKHFTLDRADGGPDSSFSLEPDEMSQLCQNVVTAHEALGKVDYGLKSSEQQNAKFRRSIYFVEHVEAGAQITIENIKSIRPGFGLPPKFFDELIGKKVNQNIKAGTPASWDKID